MSSGPWQKHEEWKVRFLAAFRQHGIVSEAAKAVGISTESARRHRRQDPEFRAAWDEAKEASVDQLEQEARRRALAGSDTLLIFMLKAYRPLFRDRVTVDINLIRQMAEQLGLDEDDVVGEAQQILLQASSGDATDPTG